MPKIQHAIEFCRIPFGPFCYTDGRALNGGGNWLRREARAGSASVIAIWPD
jgi:hypothetical protein